MKTRGRQQMLVIHAYRLGFEIEAADEMSAVQVFIDYDLPPSCLAIFARLPAHLYARWCVTQMADAAVERLQKTNVR